VNPRPVTAVHQPGPIWTNLDQLVGPSDTTSREQRYNNNKNKKERDPCSYAKVMFYIKWICDSSFMVAGKGWMSADNNIPGDILKRKPQ
jgi:hypothetical protein